MSRAGSTSPPCPRPASRRAGSSSSSAEAAMPRSPIRPLFVLLGLVLASAARAEAPASATLDVDLTDSPRGLFHAVETLPAAPGPLTLEFPRWIPGEHGPTGPIGDLAGLVFEARGR